MRQRLVNERLKNNFTQKQVAEVLDLSVIYVRKIEKGQRNPGRDTLFKFEKLYNVPAKNLFPELFQVSVDTKCIGID